MPIARPNLEDVTEADLAELVAVGASEGLHLEFKRQSYGASDSDKRELLKDVSAFANSHGGHIVIGVEETKGVATAVPGIQPENVDAEVARLGQIVRAGLDPESYGVMLHIVRMQGGASAIIIRIPRSWRAPHRVSAQSSNRFWIRNSSGCHEASMDELRVLFGQSANFLDGARKFRNERVKQILGANGSRPLVAGGRLIFHVVPQSALLSSDALDVRVIYKNHSAFAPIGSSGMSPRFNFDGVINERGGEQNHGYTQIFRNGSVEATKAGILRTGQRGLGIPGQGLEQHFFDRYESYLNGLRALGVQPPLVLMVTLEGVRGARYFVADSMFDDEHTPIDSDTLFLPDCLLTEYGSTMVYHQAIRPAFDALWNAVGHSGSRFFSPDGLWTGRLR